MAEDRRQIVPFVSEVDFFAEVDRLEPHRRGRRAHERRMEHESNARLALSLWDRPYVEQDVVLPEHLNLAVAESTPARVELFQVSLQWNEFLEEVHESTRDWTFYYRFFMRGDVSPNLDDIFVAGRFYKRPEEGVILDAREILHAIHLAKKVALNFVGVKPWKPGVMFFENIRELMVYDFTNDDVPDDLAGLVQLNTLVIEGAPATIRFADNMNLLRNLKEVRISHCELETWPRNLELVPNLRGLSLRFNRLRDIPRQVTQMTSLRRLDVSAQVPDFVPLLRGAREPPRFMRSIRTNLRALRNLWRLDLRRNGLTRVDRVLGELPALELLILSDNFVDTLDFRDGQFPRLRTLDVSHNRLRRVLPTVDVLSNLQVLNVSNNRRLEHLPGSLGRLFPTLHRIDARQTSLELPFASPLWRFYDTGRLLVTGQLFRPENPPELFTDMQSRSRRTGRSLGRAGRRKSASATHERHVAISGIVQ